MPIMVDPPGGWAYGFPAVKQEDYEKQLRDAGYPASDIPLALTHSWQWESEDELAPMIEAGVAHAQKTMAWDLARPGSDRTVMWEANPSTGESWVRNVFTGTASDGDDGA